MEKCNYLGICSTQVLIYRSGIALWGTSTVDCPGSYRLHDRSARFVPLVPLAALGVPVLVVALVVPLFPHPSTGTGIGKWSICNYLGT